MTEQMRLGLFVVQFLMGSILMPLIWRAARAMVGLTAEVREIRVHLERILDQLTDHEKRLRSLERPFRHHHSDSES